jgi:hypothetical protein
VGCGAEAVLGAPVVQAGVEFGAFDVVVSPASYRSITAVRASSLSLVHFRRVAVVSPGVRTSAESRKIRRSEAVVTPVSEFVEQR